jgi:hypothetical protein
MINPQFDDRVDMSEVQVTDLFIAFVHNLCEYFIYPTVGEKASTTLGYLQDELSAVITKALRTLVPGLATTKFDAGMVAIWLVFHGLPLKASVINQSKSRAHREIGDSFRAPCTSSSLSLSLSFFFLFLTI